MTAWIILLTGLTATSLTIAFSWFIWVILAILVFVILLKLILLAISWYKKNKNLTLDNKIKKEELNNIKKTVEEKDVDKEEIKISKI